MSWSCIEPSVATPGSTYMGGCQEVECHRTIVGPLLTPGKFYDFKSTCLIVEHFRNVVSSCSDMEQKQNVQQRMDLSGWAREMHVYACVNLIYS